MPYQLGNIKHLRFWANKVLPLVYDESLSYYECICKIMNAINRLIEVEDMQNNAIDDLDNRATSLEGRMDTAESDIDTLEDRATELEDRATSLEGRMDTAENDIDNLEDRMDTAEGDIDNLENRATALENRATSLEGRMNTAENDIDSLEGRMDTAEGDIDNLETRATQLEGRATSLESRVTTAEGDIDSLEGRMDSAESDIDSNTNRIVDLESDVTDNKDDIQNLQTTQGALMTQVGNLVDRVADDESVIEGQGTRLTTAEGEINTLQNNVTTLGNGLNTLGANVARNRSDIDSLIPRMGVAENDIDNLELSVEHLESDKEDKGDSLIDYIAVRGGTAMQLYNGYYLPSGTQIIDQEWTKGYSTFGELVGESTMIRINHSSSTFFTPLWNVRKNKDGTNKPIKIYHDTSTSGSAHFESGLGNLGDIKVIYYGRDSEGHGMSDANYFTETISDATEFTPPLTITHTPSGGVYNITAFRLLLPRAWANAVGGGVITYDTSDYNGTYPKNAVPNGGNEESVRGAIYSTALLAMENAGRLTTAEENITQNNLDGIARDRDMQSDISTLQGQIGNFSIVTLTQAQYNAIATPDTNTIYLIVG